MGQIVSSEQGEIQIKFTSAEAGQLTFEQLGIPNEALFIQGGFLRLVIDLEGIQGQHYYKVPTIEIAYTENVQETHWICEFNQVTILDKVDHHGHSTVLLLNHKTLEELEHHHENQLVVHAEFSEPTHLDAAKSYINLFK